MTSRLFVPLFTFLLSFGALAVACGDGGEALTLEEYFQQVEAASQDFDARFEALFDQFPGVFEEPAATRDFFNAAVPVLRDFVDILDDIDPPSEVEDAHNEGVDAGRDLVALSEGFTDQFADVESPSELEALLAQFEEDPEFTAAEERFTAACFALQGIADDNNIDVDLECEEEEEVTALGLEEYFQEIDTIFEDSDQALDDLVAEFEEAIDAATTVDEQADALGTFLDETNRVLFFSALQLGGLAAPPDVADFHDEFLAQIEAAAQVTEEFSSQLAGVETDVDIEALVADFDFQFSAITANADAACFALQAIADDNNIAVDLDCEEE